MSSFECQVLLGCKITQFMPSKSLNSEEEGVMLRELKPCFAN